MSCINLFGNTVWSEADIVSHGRTVIASYVSEARQNELRTIMLGHIAGMRTATAEELDEIALVQRVTEQQVLDNAQARADMDLLRDTLAYESAMRRLQQPAIEPALDEAGNVTNQPEMDADTDEREVAQAVVDLAPQAVVDLYALRNPPVPEPEPEPLPEPLPEVTE